MKIDLKVNAPLTSQAFISLLNASGLGERRPVDNLECISGMLKHANLTITAWIDQKPVGIARSVTDFHYCCYLSDIAVDQAYQQLGIGKKLIQATQNELEDTCKIVLLSAPAAVNYYPHIGFEHHPQAWYLKPKER